MKLKCISCDKVRGSFRANLSDESTNTLYQLILLDSIAKGSVINFNPAFHNFVERESNVIEITVKQKFNSDNQPEYLQLRIIESREISDGLILELEEDNTLEKYYIKVDKGSAITHTIDVLDLKKTGMRIVSIPHFYKGNYTIENWLCFI